MQVDLECTPPLNLQSSLTVSLIDNDEMLKENEFFQILLFYKAPQCAFACELQAGRVLGSCGRHGAGDCRHQASCIYRTPCGDAAGPRHRTHDRTHA